MPTSAEELIDPEGMPDALATDTNVVDVGVLQLRLPCRSFLISYKVAETGEFTLTTEFLLRLLRLVDGLPEPAIGEFFGFTAAETQFIVDVVESRGYTQRRSGRVYLTTGGHSLFLGAEEPSLFEISARQERFEFDLISFNPADQRTRLGEFENRLPELAVAATTDNVSTSEQVLRAFKRNFQVFLQRKGGPKLEKRRLYTVDAVNADQRFSVLVPVTLSVRVDDPSFVEADLFIWKTGTELDDRSSVVESCVDFVKGIRWRNEQIGVSAYDSLAEVAPVQFAGFTKGKVFEANRFFRAATRQVGNFRIDRQTVRTVGPIWTNANRTRYAAALQYAKPQLTAAPNFLIWIRPAVPYWGATTRLQDTLEAVHRHFADDGEGTAAATIKTLIVGPEDNRTAATMKHVFGGVVQTALTDLPGGLEMLIIPGLLAFVAVHCSLGGDEGFPIPLGIMSFDPSTVKRAQVEMSKLLAITRATQYHCGWGSNDVMGEVQTALLELPSSQLGEPSSTP